MLVVHVITGPGGIVFWAERAPVRELVDLPRCRAGDVPAHPFAAGAEELRDLLERLAGPPGQDQPEFTEVTVRLPSAGAQPLPSPRAESSEAEPVEPTGLAPFRVPVATLHPSRAIDALLACSDMPTGARAGDTVRWTSTLVTVALEYAAAGCVVPDLVEEGASFCARWRALPEPGDARLADLAGAAPAALQAAADQAAPADELVRQLCDTFVDAAVRDALGGFRHGRHRGGATAQWLAALCSPDAVVPVEPAALASLSRTLRRWRERADVAAGGALRTCFRLSPPELDPAADAVDDAAPAGGATEWTVELLLQARDDPSLLVPAAEVWAAPRTLRWLDREFELAQERLLADLGRAVTLWSGLEAALAEAAPERVVLDPPAALVFLREAVPLLEAAGFAVMLPALATGTERVGLRLRAAPAHDAAAAGASGLLDLGSVVEFEWQVAIGDDTVLSEEELRRLAALKQPLLRHRGRWVQVDVAALEAAVKYIESGRNRGEASAVAVLRTGLGLDPGEVDLPVQGVTGEGWVAEFLAGDASAAVGDCPVPAGFRGDLRGYQQRGLRWLRFLSGTGLGGCLADDMGLGKTVQLLALLAAEADERNGPAPAPTLLVCPTSVVTNWRREAARFTPGLEVVVHHGPGRPRGDDFLKAVRGSDLVVTTYGVASRDRDTLAALDWHRVVLDEAQLVKNAQANQSKAVRSIPARSRLALTGTPVENRLSELWSIMEFCNPGLLGSAAGFRRTFAVPIERYRDERAADLLARLVRPFVLRRSKSDPAIAPDLPDKWEETEYCTLTREQASLYQAVVDDMLDSVAAADAEGEDVRRRGLVLASIAKLKAICNHPAQFLGDGSPLPSRSGKLTRLEEVVETVLVSGARALVFTQFAEFGGRLRRHLDDTFGIDVPFLHGGVSRAGRDRIVTGFQQPDGPRLLLVSLKAGGVGLNLTAANHVLHFDRWWNPAVEDQATDRAHRIGQMRDVFVRKFVCRGTLEERIDEMLESKRALAGMVIGTGEDWLTGLSLDDLRGILSLATDAVEDEG